MSNEAAVAADLTKLADLAAARRLQRALMSSSHGRPSKGDSLASDPSSYQSGTQPFTPDHLHLPEGVRVPKEEAFDGEDPYQDCRTSHQLSPGLGAVMGSAVTAVSWGQSQGPEAPPG
ncbi:hypothetical protein THAOC_04786, partial [Thalassiosira oceanica]